MANNLDSNVSSVVLKKFAEKFESSTVLMKTVDRQLIQGELNADTGDTVYLKRPHQFNSLRTAGGDISAATKNNLISGKIPAKVSNYCTVALEYQQVEEALKLNQLDQILQPVADRIVTDVELELATFMMQNGALHLGSVGTAVTKWSDVAQTGSFMTDLGIMNGMKYAVMNPWAAQALAEKQSALQENNLVRTAWENAQISGNFGGVRALMSNALAARQVGAKGGTLTVKTTPTVTYTTVKDTYQMTVVLTGATASVSNYVRAGDIVEFATSYWVNQQTKQTLQDGTGPIKFTATVLANANSDASGDVTVLLSGVSIIDATNPQYNTVSAAITAGMSVTIRGTANATVKPNLFFSDGFVAMGTVELPKLHSIDSAVLTSNQGGLSIRVHKYSDGDKNKQMMRFDVLPAFAVMNPHMGGTFFGNP